ncbi:MAG: dTDP-4-dehydrorhamnose 3,5-epimerase [Planctomycetota bacterium]|nr:dTDP-4-dehydrorhamnose 3,5-epimerase [Planctomycetota bacterium]
MKVIPTAIPDVRIIEPRVFGDHRGYFIETWNAQRFAEHGIDATFVQDNFSFSKQGTLRGLHYQIQMTQGKLMRVVEGEIYDVCVDLRRSSNTFGQWVGVTLSADNYRSLWVPPGFAHGFFVTSEVAAFEYKCTDFYAKEHERTLLWNDPALGIEWPIPEGLEPLITEKDREGQVLLKAEVFP